MRRQDVDRFVRASKAHTSCVAARGASAVRVCVRGASRNLCGTTEQRVEDGRKKERSGTIGGADDMEGWPTDHVHLEEKLAILVGARVGGVGAGVRSSEHITRGWTDGGCAWDPSWRRAIAHPTTVGNLDTALASYVEEQHRLTIQGVIIEDRRDGQV